MTATLGFPVHAARHSLYGMTFSSDIPLPNLISGTGGAPEVRISRLNGLGSRPTVSPFLSIPRPTGKPWLSCFDETDGYRLQFPDLADFLVDRSGSIIRYTTARHTPPDVLQHLILNQVLPLILNLRGQEALHATAILTPNGVCAFAGPAGAGKSTLAASFQLAGYPVICDDCLVLREDRDRIVALPAYPGIRLAEDAVEGLKARSHVHRSNKRRTSKHLLLVKDPFCSFPSEPQPLIRVYTMAPFSTEKPSPGFRTPLIEPLSLRDGFIEVLACLFRLDVADRRMLHRQFEFVNRLTAHVPVSRLRVPHTFSTLAAVRRMIVEDLKRADR